jgi:hypothetical protein
VIRIADDHRRLPLAEVRHMVNTDIQAIIAEYAQRYDPLTGRGGGEDRPRSARYHPRLVLRGPHGRIQASEWSAGALSARRVRAVRAGERGQGNLHLSEGECGWRVHRWQHTPQPHVS